MHNEKIKCQYCDKEFSINGIGTHIWRKHGKGVNHNPNKGFEDGTRNSWNKGLTKETDERVKQIADTYSKHIEDGLIKSSFKGKNHSESSKLLMKEKYKERLKNGTNHTWTSRKNVKSYAELFFEDVLRNNNLLDKSISEYHINDNRINYFLDFYFPDSKIDLEIDGSQHELRKEADNKRDEFLKSIGIKVYRIKWININTVKGKEIIKNEIEKFLNFYKEYVG